MTFPALAHHQLFEPTPDLARSLKMKHLRVLAVLAAAGLLAYLGWSALHPQKVAASNAPAGTFLINITDATTGDFVSHTVITLHADHTAAAIDSGQEGQFPVPFSSQLGAWAQNSSGVVNVKTLDFSFPFATQGSARVDYKF